MFQSSFTKNFASELKIDHRLSIIKTHILIALPEVSPLLVNLLSKFVTKLDITGSKTLFLKIPFVDVIPILLLFLTSPKPYLESSWEAWSKVFSKWPEFSIYSQTLLITALHSVCALNMFSDFACSIKLYFSTDSISLFTVSSPTRKRGLF